VGASDYRVLSFVFSVQMYQIELVARWGRFYRTSVGVLRSGGGHGRNGSPALSLLGRGTTVEFSATARTIIVRIIITSKRAIIKKMCVCVRVSFFLMEVSNSMYLFFLWPSCILYS